MWRGVAGTPACSPRAGTRPCVCGTWRRWCRIERSAGITEASKPSPFNRRAAGTSSRVAAATAPSRCGTRARADVGRAPRATARTASPHPPRRRCWSARTNPGGDGRRDGEGEGTPIRRPGRQNDARRRQTRRRRLDATERAWKRATGKRHRERLRRALPGGSRGGATQRHLSRVRARRAGARLRRRGGRGDQTLGRSAALPRRERRRRARGRPRGRGCARGGWGCGCGGRARDGAAARSRDHRVGVGAEGVVARRRVVFRLAHRGVRPLRPRAPPVCHLRGHRAPSFYVKAAFSPDGTHVASGSCDQRVYVWRVDRPAAPPTALRGHEGEVTAVDWCPTDFTRLASCADDDTARVWSIDRREREDAEDARGGGGDESRDGHSARRTGRENLRVLGLTNTRRGARTRAGGGVRARRARRSREGSGSRAPSRRDGDWSLTRRSRGGSAETKLPPRTTTTRRKTRARNGRD